MQLLQRRRNMGKALANPDHAPLPAENVRRAEAEESGNEGEGIGQQGAGRAEPEDAAAGEDHPVDLQTGGTADRQEAREVPRPQPAAAGEPEEEAHALSGESGLLAGREEEEELRAPMATTPQAQTTAAGTTGETLTEGVATLAPRDGDRASEAEARRSHAEQREDVGEDGDGGRSRHEPGDADGSARGESDILPRDVGGGAGLLVCDQGSGGSEQGWRQLAPGL
ncbi:unnamed protein product [Closterium sp. Naga37s-1]|nr:unnamed protein product [Closterium sp. Naga37s-1]